MVLSHVLFAGTVQGVGFRYTTQRFARELRLQGWVKNLRDGGVEMVAEGPRERIENLLYKLDTHFQGKITHTDIDWLEARGQFTDFVITY